MKIEFEGVSITLEKLGNNPVISDIDKNVIMIKQWRVPSFTEPNVNYIVTQDIRNNIWTCTCPDHINRVRDCKHIKDVMSNLHKHERLTEFVLFDHMVED